MTKNQKKKSYIIGIDEVGRGPLAGPVTCAAVVLARNRHFRGLKDSKKLTPERREQWCEYVKTKDIFHTLASVSPKVIDKINIRKAANLAATRTVQRIIKRRPLPYFQIYLDGGLYINEKNLAVSPKKLKAKTLIRGDERVNAIKLASIMAKVRRDKYMKTAHKKYSEYDFRAHKGYGTPRHIKAIKKYGPSEIHRLTFVKKYIRID